MTLAVKVEGLTVNQVAERFGVSTTTVHNACVKDFAAYEALLEPRGKKRSEQHRRIAMAVRKEVLTVTAAAEKFHVATNHVRMACAEHGAQPRVAQPTSNVRMLQIVADIARGKSRKQICDERCLSRERVRQIKDKAEAAGSIKSHFAAALRRCRKANGLTQADAAAIAGIGQTHWSAYESGSSTNPSLDHIIAMAAALGVKVSELLDSPPAPDATAMLRHEREIDPKRNQNA